MLSFLKANYLTIIIIAVLVLIVALIIRSPAGAIAPLAAAAKPAVRRRKNKYSRHNADE